MKEEHLPLLTILACRKLSRIVTTHEPNEGVSVAVAAIQSSTHASNDRFGLNKREFRKIYSTTQLVNIDVLLPHRHEKSKHYNFVLHNLCGL